jgi:tetrahydromethanopterin S-methyltransferase subunit A
MEPTGKIEAAPLREAAARLQEAAANPSCWHCSCFHNAIPAFARAYPPEQRPAALEAVLAAARERLGQVRYDCLGCDTCYPALALNALEELGGENPCGGEVCPAEQVQERRGWPPLPGSYKVMRYQAPVAVCTLTDEQLMAGLGHLAGPAIALVGTMFTENLGIERLIKNILANPNLRFLIVCGPDSHQTVGHLPGQSLLALARSGVDERSRIIGARGKRPILRNISRDAVEHFRRTVEVLDLIGIQEVSAVAEAADNCLARNPGPAAPFAPGSLVRPVPGYLPARMVPDPAGYVVIYVDRLRRSISLEHYRNDGVLDTVITGAAAAEVYIPAVDRGLVSRLDHAAYLGQELARAELALASGEDYRQDGAPECAPPPVALKCACGSSCGEAGS